MRDLIVPSRKELLYGSLYLLVHLALLPTLLGEVFSLFSLSAVWKIILSTALEAGVILWIFHGYLRRSLQHFFQKPLACLGLAACGLGVYLLLNSLLNLLFVKLALTPQNLNNNTVTDMLAQAFWSMTVCTVVLTPLLEEVLYRGILFAGLSQKSRLAAYAVSAVVFAAIHVLPYLAQYTPEMFFVNFVQYLPAGLVLAGSYALSGTPIVPMLIHCAVNTIGILAMR